MNFYERIKLLAKEQQKTLQQVEQDLGYGKKSLYEYKKRQAPANRVTELAQYFNVSADYLLGKTDEKIPDLDELFDDVLNYNGKPLTEHDKQIFRDYLEGRIDAKVEFRTIGE